MSDAAPRAAVARAQRWPDLTFWYRLPPSELLKMPHALRLHYEEALPRLKAELLEQQINASAFPHMQKNDQRKMIERIGRVTRRDEAALVETPTSTEDEMRRAAAAGIGFEMV